MDCPASHLVHTLFRACCLSASWALAFLMPILGSSSEVLAAFVPVVNPSFESPVYAKGDGGAATAWVSSPNPSYAGIANLTPAQAPRIPQGRQIAYAGLGGALTQ